MARPEADTGRASVDPRYRAWLRARQGARQTLLGEPKQAKSAKRKISRRVAAIIARYRVHDVPTPTGALDVPANVAERLLRLQHSVLSYATPAELAEEIEDLIWLTRPASILTNHDHSKGTDK